MAGVHATDPVSVFVAAWARTSGVVVADVEEALYERRTLVRLLGMRRTLFVVPVDDMPMIEAAAGRALGPPQRKRTARWVEEAGITDDGLGWLREVEDAAVAALDARGPSTATELSEDVAELRLKIPVNQGKRYAGHIGVSSRVLLQLAIDGRVVRGRPRGSIVSSQYRWATTRTWLGHEPVPPPVDAAAADLARRWLRAFGPATVEDLRWWTGWTSALTRRALAAIEPVEVDMDGVTGLVLPDDTDDVEQPGPWTALLPALDSTVMGWKHRDWFLQDHRAALFDRNGNAGPTIWSDGRVVGGWAQRPDGEIALRFLDDVGADVVAAVEGQAERLTQWIGDIRWTPRFRTPLERELTA